MVGWVCSAADDTLGMLKFVQLHGNALVYLWRTGQQPDAVESVVSEVVLSDECDDDGAAQEVRQTQLFTLLLVCRCVCIHLFVNTVSSFLRHVVHVCQELPCCCCFVVARV